MNKRNCEICNKEIGIYEHHSKKYCSKSCKSEADKINKRIKKQRNILRNSKQKCRRCHDIFIRQEDGHRYYCKKCIDITSNGKEIHKCMDCKTEITLLRKRCESCASISKRKQIERKNEEAVKQSKEIQEKNKTKTKKIHPRFLERNYSGEKFSTQGRCNSFGL